jgi:hypothetical protein
MISWYEIYEVDAPQASALRSARSGRSYEQQQGTFCSKRKNPLLAERVCLPLEVLVAGCEFE